MASADGDKFETLFRKICNEIPCFHIKFPDVKSFLRLIGKPPKKCNVPEALCDRLVIYRGYAILVELKHREKDKFYFDGRAFRQLGRLISANESGGAYGFFIFDLPDGVYALFCRTICAYLKTHDTKTIPESHIAELGHSIKNPDDFKHLMDSFIDQ